MVPIRIACWLAGVVQGNCTSHSWNSWEPAVNQRRRVGMLPESRAHFMTGWDAPSSWMNRMPSISGSLIWPGLMRSNEVANDSSVPALTIHASRVPKAAAIQAAANESQNESTVMPGTTLKTICITMAWPNRVARATAHQPMAADTWTRTGRTMAPTTPVTAAAAASGHQDVAVKPGINRSVRSKARKEKNQATSRRTMSPDRIRDHSLLTGVMMT